MCVQTIVQKFWICVCSILVNCTSHRPIRWRVYYPNSTDNIARANSFAPVEVTSMQHRVTCIFLLAFYSTCWILGEFVTWFLTHCTLKNGLSRHWCLHENFILVESERLDSNRVDNVHLVIAISMIYAIIGRSSAGLCQQRGGNKNC